MGGTLGPPATSLVKPRILGQSVGHSLLPIVVGRCQVGLLQNPVLLSLVEKAKLIVGHQSHINTLVKSVCRKAEREGLFHRMAGT